MQLGIFDDIPPREQIKVKPFIEPLTFGSVCSGIEAASIAWEPLGFKAEWFSQYDPEHDYSKGPDFPSAVLAYHWPEVPNLGDMTTIKDRIVSGEVKAPQILIGGTPCQAFSVAGKRGGLNDSRGNLALKFIEIANTIDEMREDDECVVVWENVPGVLSDKQNAFGCFLGKLVGEDCELQPSGKKWSNAGCVFGPQRAAAWRILDAQYFGVAQRRRRVLVVASARGGFDPTKVLFESEGVRRDTAPCREKKETVAALTACGVGTCGADDNQAQAGHLITHPPEIANTLTARMHKGVNSDLNEGQSLVVHGTQDPGCEIELAYSLGRNHGQENAVFIAENQRGEIRTSDVSTSLNAGGGKVGQGYHAIYNQHGIRRLTPMECERLQGFPDNHTQIPWGNKTRIECPDGHRYKANGNSMATPKFKWLGQRLKDYLT